MHLRSPAKVNLFFRVLYKREDGFHEIESLYQAISIFDEISLSKADSFSLTCDLVASDETNLITKAYRAFVKKWGHECPVRIDCRKKIPIGAGLGGGSSNAATTLFGLNELLGRPFSLQALSELGAEIGSDVPFFFSRGTALATGRGERVKEAPRPGFDHLWILSPPIYCSTPKVYGSCIPGEGDLNDLQPAAFRLYPELASYEKLARECFERVWLTGSGSSFVCLDPKDYIEKMPATRAQLIYRKANEWW